MILRPKDTLDGTFQRSLEEEYLLQDLEELPLCQNCQRYVEDDFVLCPHCHTTLREPCVSCGRLVHLRWSLCPYCGTEQSEKAAAAREKVEVPAARWRSPIAPRKRTTPAIVARPTVLQPRPEVPVPVVADLTPSTTTETSVAALTVVRETSNGNGTGPVRLFDRKKTRAAQKNGSNGSLAHANGNGSNNHAPYLVGTTTSQNGHSPNGNGSHVDHPASREKVGATPADAE
jgi:RNA polymerase subunit RPABC4/transcription elongation factor Spt4